MTRSAPRSCPGTRTRSSPLRARRLFAFLLLLSALRFSTASGQSCVPEQVALVLSGGGAKGLAHIGVLEVMDSLGIRPNLVVGTSMGAIVGALYASGYSGKQIDSLGTILQQLRARQR